VLRAKQAIGEIVVHVLRSADLQKIRLVVDIDVVGVSWRAVRDIESQAQSGVGVRIVTPKQQIVPVTAEAQEPGSAPEMLDVCIQGVFNCRVGYV
jgi:hypothetical protein